LERTKRSSKLDMVGQVRVVVVDSSADLRLDQSSD
jgi:hypothetical protein